MPELIEQMYCSQQIVIPPKYPYILKRYCKAAIKTQPYDLLRWSFEYFKALAEHRPPPVKLRLEYPVYSTEGGLTRGCLKVLANQLSGMTEIPLHVVKQAWQGFCLDPVELKRILCLCEVFMRQESVPYLHFLAVAGGMLTKCLTHTMILLCESLTKEPDGGSAAIPVKGFLDMYMFLANMDASQDVKYYNGFREGDSPSTEEQVEEEETTLQSDQKEVESTNDDDYWESGEVVKLALIDDHVGRTARLSVKMNLPVIGKIERSPSIERAKEIEREAYMRERKGRAEPSEEVDKKLKELSDSIITSTTEVKTPKDDIKAEDKVDKKDAVEIFVYDEDNNSVQFEIYGEPKDGGAEVGESATQQTLTGSSVTATTKGADEQLKEEEEENETIKLALFLAEICQQREERLNDIEQTYDEIAVIVDKYKTANYDLGMVAGRQMSTTSGEFIVQHIEKEILDYIDEQIAILPDPNLKKKKAKPEEVAMIRDLIEQFLDDNMEIIVPEVEEVEEEEAPMPEIITVYAVPGIGGLVDIDLMTDFEDYAVEVSRIQGDMIMPRNIRHFLCPPLEKYIEHKYDVEIKREEVPTGGVITD